MQKRWKTLRDAFVKERRELGSSKSGSAASKKKQYKYYKQLLFLLPVVSTNTTHNSMVNEEDEDPVDRSHEESMITPRPKKTKKMDPTDEIGSELINVSKSTMQQKTQEEDPDRQFMLSLVSDFKRVPLRLKPMIKINILKCIMEVQDEMYDSHQVQRAEHSPYLYSNQQNEGYYTRSEEPSTSFNQAHDHPRGNCFETASPSILKSLNINQEDPSLLAFATPQHEVRTSPKSINTQNSDESELLQLFD